MFTDGNDIYFHPLKSKSQTDEALQAFLEDVGTPRILKFDGAKEQTGPKSKFMSLLRKMLIKFHVTEPYTPHQNQAEDAIRDLKRRAKLRRAKHNIPTRLWCYLYKYESELISLIPRGKDDVVPRERTLGETRDISEYTDFEFFETVWFWDHPNDTKNPVLGKWLGVSHRIGAPLTFYVLKANGRVESRSSVQHVTDLDKEDPKIKSALNNFDESITSSLQDDNFLVQINPEDQSAAIDWTEESTQGEIDVRQNSKTVQFQGELNNAEIQPTHFPDILDRDQYVTLDETQNQDFTEDTVDSLIGVELNLPTADGVSRATVRKRIKDADGNPIGCRANNPMHDTRMYQVEHYDGTFQELQGNIICENMISEIDDEGRHYLLIDEIENHQKMNNAVPKSEGFIYAKNGNKHRKFTTRGWKFLVRWKDGSTDWKSLKELKLSYPLELAEYAKANDLIEEPAFAWWAYDALRTHTRIISKTKTKYWRTTHKYGIELPHSVEEALAIDTKNKNNLWRNAIEKEMKKIKLMGTFEKYDKYTPDDIRKNRTFLPGFKEITLHMIFDVKLDSNFTRKARLVADGHKTDPPLTNTYSTVVSRDSVRIAFLYASLNDLDVLGCDVSNAYLYAECKEKLWISAGKEFGSDQGTVMVIKKALYGLKTSGASWRSKISETLVNLGYTNTIADPDVWRRPGKDNNGNEFYELVLVYVDDLLCVSNKPSDTMIGLASLYDLKDTVKPPERYLGNNINKYQLPDGREAWAMGGKDYVANAVKVAKEIATKNGMNLPGGERAKRPYPKCYCPELDTSPELDKLRTNQYQQLIGILRWAIELGRLDILYEVSCLSSHLASPRKGHFDATMNIFGYLYKHLDCTLVLDDLEIDTAETSFTKSDWSDTIYGNDPEELPPKMPMPRGNPIKISCFVDADHAGDLLTRRSHTGILIFLNNAPVIWYSKKQNTVESSTFGSEFVAMRIACDLLQTLRYKLRMFGIPIQGECNVFCDNGSVVKCAQMPEGRLTKKHNAICFHRVRECVARRIIRVSKEDGTTNLADLFTKALSNEKRREILQSIYIKGG